MKRRNLISFTLGMICLCMISIVTAFAETESELVANGTCGNQLTWSLDSEGLLTISGNGDMWGYTSFYTTPWANYIQDVKELKIEDGVTSIGSYTFGVITGMEKVTIPDSVTEIGAFAFCSCPGLTEVKIPDNVTAIGRNAFADCSALTEIEIPEGAISIGQAAFTTCSSLTKVTILNGVKKIGASAFASCKNLKEITFLADSTSSVSGDAFLRCDSLMRVDIENMADWCGTNFSNSNSNPLYFAGNLYLNGNLVKELDIPNGTTSIGKNVFNGYTKLISVTVPDSVEKVGDSAFCGCKNITNLTVPENVKEIGSKAFYGCSGLKSVEIADLSAWCEITFSDEYSNPLYYAKNIYKDGKSVTNLTIPDDAVSIGNYAFYGCTSITDVTVPENVKEIGEYAFAKCSGLKNITISDGVTVIHAYAFTECKNLANIEIPDSVTSISASAFYNCSGIINVTIGSGVETIEMNTFYNCSNLKCITLSEKLSYIRYGAFQSCGGLEAVFYTGSESQWENVAIEDRNSDLLNAQIIFNATKKTYKFVTNCDTVLPDVNDYAIISAPVVKKEGMKLQGWYDNEALEGMPVVFPYYKTATTLYASWVEKGGTDFDDAIVLEENEQYAVSVADDYLNMYFEFTPTKSKSYRIYTNGEMDTYGDLLSSGMSYVETDDNSGDANNFSISCKLTAGEKYYIVVSCYNGPGAFVLCVEEVEEYRLNPLVIKTRSGREISEIPTDLFYAAVSLTNVSSNENAVIVLEQYSKDGALVGLMNIGLEDFPVGATTKVNMPVNNTNGNVAKIKVLCLKELDSLQPLAKTMEFPLSDE